MIVALKGWLTAVLTTAVMLTVAEKLVPEGSLRKIASITGGLILLLVLVQPVTKLQVGQLRLDYGAYADAVRQRQQELQAENTAEMAELIAERTEAYILDKAASLGISCQAVVTTAPGEDGLPCPVAAELSCPPSEALAECLESELGIPKERQVFHGTE